MILGGGSKLATAPGTYDSLELVGLPLWLFCSNWLECSMRKFFSTAKLRLQTDRSFECATSGLASRGTWGRPSNAVDAMVPVPLHVPPDHQYGKAVQWQRTEHRYWDHAQRV